MSIMKLFGMGNASKVSSAEVWPDDTERYYGLENVGGGYCNSILQALYFCKPFRDCVTNYPYGPIPALLREGASGSEVATDTTADHTATTTAAALNAPSPSTIQPGSAASQQSTADATRNPSANGQGDDASSGTLRRPEALNHGLFAELQNLFWKINQQKRQSGVMTPGQFVSKVRKDNELFRGTMHQDAHEFLIYILNTVAENVLDYEKECHEQQTKTASHAGDNGSSTDDVHKGWAGYFGGTRASTADASSVASSSSASSASASSSPPTTTWVHRLFEGVLTNETKCLTCETVTNRDECFLDLSIDIEQHSSVTSCLRQFSTSEMLCYKNKFFCDTCCALQEAEKRMKIKRLPKVLALHLKRFKYQERVQRYIKLSYRVVGPHHGHYVCIIKSADQWLLFDDDCVQIISEDDIPRYFGGLSQNGSGYLLFYQVAAEDKLAHV
ncbi:hypothetical protein SYNPS1DRAFT_33020 [Syncephalis pseudoplumigaleata]|uniref:ubiquitinyl hydrolase 1 n=1 Tax=Syncephalis pseudoplumigaleata TaxID=1712513 RepID=A0A4V1J1J0_9FUNG|nr:hypothetical protein SYNPS1DRAFT_33020 [Syncephalis pseudoplumigaleata]|eukprot:RKP25229.1 hypothetical protein SYNPS1DRAFT_33020 [Syncephalis pseudoplumigaleata]